MGKYKYTGPISYCAECGGQCCKNLPGFCAPKDISRLFPQPTLRESVIAALDSGTFAVDWYEASEPKPYLRPMTTLCTRRHDPSWGGECIFLRSDGCQLGDQRPHGCKVLKAKKGGGCTDHYKMNGKLAISREWKKTGLDLMNL